VPSSIVTQQNQADVERATEKLSEYLERDITTASIVEIKQQVQDKYRWVAAFLCGGLTTNQLGIPVGGEDFAETSPKF